MANQETRKIDEIIASRRAMLLGGGALAALAFAPQVATAAATVTAYTDADILNFALNLEYLEANFYYMAAFGTTIDKPTPASIAAGASSTAIGLGGVANGTNPAAGVTASFGTATRVPFTIPAVAAYAVETAIEEGKHVILLRGALGAAAVAQPPLAIDPVTFTAVANAAGIAGVFNPYGADALFLVGAYIFEDVGVSAYHGAAPLLTSTANLITAGGILAVEAYHSGLVRNTINFVDPVNAAGYLTITDQVSALRAGASLAALATASNPDDFGLLTPANAQPSTGVGLGSSTTAQPRTQIADLDSNAIAWSRNTTQVLNIVTLGKATTAGTAAKGGFFPSGLNGLFV